MEVTAFVRADSTPRKPARPAGPPLCCCPPASPQQQQAFGRDVLCVSPTSPLISTSSSCLFGGFGRTHPSQSSCSSCEDLTAEKRRLNRVHSGVTESLVGGLDMRGQVAVLTGGTSQIGREIAWALCMAGAH
eukprot:scaffold541279_cov44-Prasinocladus_malaysianus.AAC.1